ncbi:MAG: hypothetical protein QHJ73_06335, partial [Armatimonadota bacterium]|nr:hypothetical protein [Armatimonadota bacterium]
VSDAGMAYFLLTGDERCDIAKLRRLLVDKARPAPIDPRPTIRVEAENFRTLDGFQVKDRYERNASQQVCVLAAPGRLARMQTPFNEPYAAVSGRYNLDVRYAGARGGVSRLELAVNGQKQGPAWEADGSSETWQIRTIPGVLLREGDQIAITVQSDGGAAARVDYVELHLLGARGSTAPAPATGALHVAEAMPGQVIVDPHNRSWLRYNGGGPVFIAGVGEPENFLYRGTRNPDGTRNGDQMALIQRLAGTGVNCIYVIGFVDERYGGDGTPNKDGKGNPFEEGNVNGEIDPDILNQWDEWFTAMEAQGILIYFVLYDDLIDVLPGQRLGWDLDANGNLHPQERKYVDAVVNRFKHHRRLIWCVNESANKNYPASYVARWKKIAARIHELDPYRHPIALGLVVPTDPDRTADTSEERYAGDATFNQSLVQHVRAQTAEEMHRIFLEFWRKAAGQYNLLLAQAWPLAHGADARQKSWAVAMAGSYFMHATASRRPNEIWSLDGTPSEEWRAMGHLVRFFEAIPELTAMSPRDDLAFGQTRWVLADEGRAYVAYAYDARENLGLRNIPTGTYRLRWLDCASGETREETGRRVAGGDTTWPKPPGIGPEVALYLVRASGDSAAEKGWTLRVAGVLEGFEAPECVVVDPATGFAYVSNIAAPHDPNSREQYWAADGTGFVSRLKPGGVLEVLRWRESGPQLLMNAPKGMCILKGQLEVNDIAHLLRIPLTGGGTGRRMAIPGAQRLNDAATDGRAVFLSDTAQGVVYRVVGEQVRVLKAPPGVNGITFARGKMFAVSRTLHEVYEMDPEGRRDPKPFGVADHFSGLDGIEVLPDGTYLVSDIAGNKVCAISPDGKKVSTLAQLESPADIGLDRQRMLLYVPQLTKDCVTIYHLEKR